MPNVNNSGMRSFTCPGKPGSDMALSPSDSLAGYPLAMAYVPWQYLRSSYEPDKALKTGTIFPELDKPFLGKRGCRL